MIKSSVARYAGRLAAIRKSMEKKRIDGFLVTDIHNVRYLTGFSGSSGLVLLTKRSSIFVTDFRYKEQSAQEIAGWEIVIQTGNWRKTIKLLARKTGIKRLGFESSVSFSFYRMLAGCGFRLRSVEGIMEELRQIKDAEEIGYIQEAVRRAESAFLDVKPFIRQGISERAIALRLEKRLKQQGCNCIPFDIIVASGLNTVLPHARPTEKKLQPGDLVIIDWGAEAQGYFSDMTRTVLIEGGKNTGQKKEIFRVVLEANEEAISRISDGVASTVIDSAAREAIRRAGFSEFFGHGTGHGLGMQVHEAPRITWMHPVTVRKGMVFTIEPGIYMPGLGGARIEDIVLVRKDGAQVITTLPRKLEIL